MSKTVTLTWVDPTNKFTGVEVSMRAVGAPDFTVLVVAPPGVQNMVVPDLADGDYEFKVTSLNGSLRAAGVVVPASVVTEVAPNDVTNVQVKIA